MSNQISRSKQELFSANLRAALAARSMTQNELAQAAGTTPAAISRYANALRTPRAASAAALAEALGTTVDALYGVEPAGDALEQAVALVVARAHELSRGQRAMIACACAKIGSDDQHD